MPRSARFNRVVADFNGTRSSDVFVVNFGVHYHDTPEHDQEYRDAVFPILDQMAEVGKTATVIWRWDGGGHAVFLVTHNATLPPFIFK